MVEVYAVFLHGFPLFWPHRGGDHNPSSGSHVTFQQALWDWGRRLYRLLHVWCPGCILNEECMVQPGQRKTEMAFCTVLASWGFVRAVSADAVTIWTSRSGQIGQFSVCHLAQLKVSLAACSRQTVPSLYTRQSYAAGMLISSAVAGFCLSS